nr:2-oxoglutarate dehydrogenase E1 component [Lottiidibacillus patelloidae]
MKNEQITKLLTTISGHNLGYLYEAYERYLKDESTVDASLRSLFDNYGEFLLPDLNSDQIRVSQQRPDVKKVLNAIKLFGDIRQYGHLAAKIHPLQNERQDEVKFANLESYHLSEGELQKISASLLLDHCPEHIKNGMEAYEHLLKVYTSTVTFEFDHIHNAEEKRWLENYIEKKGIYKTYSKDKRVTLLRRLQQVETFEKFLHKTFVSQKRFSIEGLDMLIPMLDELVNGACEDRTKSIMIGMAHRGRLNVLAHVLGKPYELIFSEFHHSPNKDLVPSEGSRGINYGWSGDVKYHLGAKREVNDEDQHTVQINLANNPSHLEYVNSVVQGITRAAQENRKEPGFPNQNKQASFNVLIHGDAAFPGEGVVAETLNLSRLKGYGIGGSIHIIANNLLGFTTDSVDSRSTKYASDIAKGFEIPIIHVNADDPERCLEVIKFAYEYRKKFNKDILIDLIGYRRFGHNEMDDPNVTQPQLYKKIKEHPTVLETYAHQLIADNLISEKDVRSNEEKQFQKLQTIFDELSKKDQKRLKKQPIPKEVEKGLSEIDTSVPIQTLQNINTSIMKKPDGFKVYPKLEKILKKRANEFNEDGKINWALAETLAFATILADGKPIRLTGQDSERGTFAHRHMVLHDYKTNERFIPLHNFKEAKASFSIYNSALSEAAVLGFEYGYSVYAKEALVLWEAQFGDFVNAAQVIIDQFIAAGRAKWGQKSSLVMLLPHGYEGQGPEHSSARLERFLQSAAENNWTVANVTTASQYFHILRRQMCISEREEARPLIIMTPKSLLRHSQTASASSEFSSGRFKQLLIQQDIGKKAKEVKRLILCSGKVAVDITSKLEESAGKVKNSIKIARVEQLYPFPKEEIRGLIKKLVNVKEIIWVQEEPKNMGAWPVIQELLSEIIESNITIKYIGRPKRSSPATGLPDFHIQEQDKIIEEALFIEEGGGST